MNPNATFTITPTEIGSTYFKVNISCSDPSVFFYYDVLLPDIYETYCDSKPENIPSYMATYLSSLKSENNTYSKMSMAEFISAITVEGEAEYDTALSEAANSLVPEMEYPVFAIGIANDGTFTTNATVQMVKTAETLPNDWILTDEKTTDIQYNATIAPKWDEAYAVILERKMYFEGESDEEMVNDLLAARGGSFLNDLCITRAKVEFPMVAIQVIGDVSAACLGSIDRMPTERELSGAIVSQGLTSMVGGLLGGLPTSALGQNVGIICSNKVVNKWVFVIIAAVFAIAGLFPQLSAVLSAIPQPVIGGATVGVFGTITMNGVRMFTREGLTQRTTTIVGTSVVFGLGIWMASGCLAGEGMPTWVSTVIGSNAVTPTAIMAIVLNLILPQTPVVAQHIDAAKDAAVDLVLPESKK